MAGKATGDRRRSGRGAKPVAPAQQIRVGVIDYKDVATLRKFISERGKIRSRRITGACRRHQNQVAAAVKRARELALLPYVNESGKEERPGGRGGRDRDREDR